MTDEVRYSNGEVKLLRGLLAFGLGLCGCQNAPQAFAPPEQRPQLRELYTSSVVSVGDVGARGHFVQDIDDYVAAGTWSWTRQRPTVRVRVGYNASLKYTIDFALAQRTLKDTGPVNLSFYVNDHLLDRVRYVHAGQLHFEKPVPPEFLRPGATNTVAAEIDKVWVSQDSGARLGFILVRMGLAP